ncbi:MAG: bifunctional YncE family protein/alkaline phosphatase family protein [Planctomycetia bacterium]|nr:bifunctional YncE family protein/alkaline phosphatase family protein [Planctomycetia bacterium]
MRRPRTFICLGCFIGGLLAWLIVALTLAVEPRAAADEVDDAVVGPPAADGSFVVASGQYVRPAGQSLAFGGRPVDLVLSPDGRTLYAKDNRGLLVLNTADWTLRQTLPFGEAGGSLHGIAVSQDGKHVYATDAARTLFEGAVGGDGLVTWTHSIDLPGPEQDPDKRDAAENNAFGCGIALSTDGATAYVCLSRNNTLGVVSLAEGRLIQEIPVGVAPFDVALSPDGATAYISNWGGRRAKTGERTAKSAGTDTLIDERGVASSGTLGKIDLEQGAMTAEVEVGLHPSDLELAHDGATLYVANANSDTVACVSTNDFKILETISTRPLAELPFGSMPNAIALSRDGRTLYAANGGNNAVAVIQLAAARGEASRLLGFIPTAWYPGGVVVDDTHLYVANIKGEGSRNEEEPNKGWNSHWHRGTITKCPLPSAETLKQYTEQVVADAQIPAVLRALEKSQSKVDAVPVPAKQGEPSVFEHVIYVIKENRTYDQVFGDFAHTNADPSLCIFGRDVSPNHHAIAEQFVILDNYYCNGVLSADGHSWATEGNVTDHLEKAFGGFARSYTFGDDPITYSSTGFIWDNALGHGLSFRNYGEFDTTETVPKQATFLEIYRDYQNKAGKIQFRHTIGIDRLRQYSHPEFQGWNMNISDVQRMDVFLEEFRKFEESGALPNLIIMTLPQDHGSGMSPGSPTPRAHMADNDLAVGRLVEAVSKSKFWPKTCIFINEDDPQNGFDHVDGHRSICLVVSPYTKRGEVVSKFYNQTSVIHTIERMLSLPPMNQMDALAPLMSDCFVAAPDLTPYAVLPNNIPLDELNPAMAQLGPQERHWAELSLKQDFTKVDRADEDSLNRIIWHAVKGVDAPYPADWAGPHGKGLASLGLSFDPNAEDEEEEEEERERAEREAEGVADED